MSTPLKGKVALITGAGRGLGRQMAEALSDAGAHLVVAARTTAQIDDFAASVRARGRQALAVPSDVTDQKSVDLLVDRTLEHFGRVDILINNSGVVDTTTLLAQEPADWDRVVDTNLRGVYLMTRTVGRHLVAQGSGKVINVASNFALMGVSHHAAYAASKAGVIAFTKSMAIEWARHDIQVNALAPGYFATDINADLRRDEAATRAVLRRIPARRMGRPEELSPWAVLLAGPASDFMTGQTLVIDGGQSAQ